VTTGKGHDRRVFAESDKLLKKAGWVIKDGVRVNEKTGKPLTFEFLLGDPSFEKVVLAFQRNLAPLGIKMKIRTVAPAQYMAHLGAFDYDMIMTGVLQSEMPGNELRAFWGSKEAHRKNGQNAAGIEDPVVDALIELVIAAPDQEALKTRVHALDRVLQWNYYGVPTWYQDSANIAYWNKFGMPEKKPQDGVGLFSWWVLPPQKD